jgi:hypothetical protein
MSVSPKYWLKYKDINQDIGIDRPKKIVIGQNGNIGISIGG